MRARHRLAASAVALTLASASLVGLNPLAASPAAAAPPPTTGTTIVNETFTNATVPDAGWTAQGTTCLTGAPAGTTPGPALANCSQQRTGPVPALGVTPGYLQLTDTRNNAAGSILYNRPIPATAGLTATFEQYQYGGTGADGIGFFLVDGATNLTQTGGNGGSLGYAQRTEADGVLGGYVGVGLDAYGNFYDDGEGRGTNCPPGQRSPSSQNGAVAPNVVTIRGPGSGRNGYCYQQSTTDPASNPNHPTSTLPGQLRAPTGTTNPATAKRIVNVQITPAPNPRVIVQIDFGDGNGFQPVLNTPAPANTPSTYKFGFAASTGGSTDVHLLRNVVVATIDPLDDLQLVKQVDRTGAPLPAVITAGTRIPYQYVVTNAGNEALTNVSVADNKLTGVICASTTLPPEPDPAASTVCHGSYLVTAADVTAGQVHNTAFANALAPGNAPVQSNQSDVTVPLVSALRLTKQVTTPAPYVVGQQLNYAYTVTNTGGSTVSTIAVTDNRVATGGVLCTATNLAPGQSSSCTATTTLAAANLAPDGSLTNTATATGVTPIGQSVTSNIATATIQVGTDIAITKTASDLTPFVGDQVSFTVTAHNNGPAIGTGAVVNDRLPSGLTFIAATPSAGTSYQASNGNWSIPTLAVGASATLVITATVTVAGALTNGATLTALNQPDINPANDSDSVTLNPIVPTTDIAITKSVATASIRVGQTTSFTVTATNEGPSAATGVSVIDPLPSRLELTGASATQGSYNAATGVWTIGALAVGQSETLTITVTATAVGTYQNTAGLFTVSPQDINQANDTDTAVLTVTPALADLQLVKAIVSGTEDLHVGDIVTYSVTVTNAGPDDVPDVVVTDTGPAGLTVVGSDPSQGTVNVPELTWDVGAVAVGASAIIFVHARIDTPGTKDNLAVVSSATVEDPDQSNNSDDATLTASPTPLDIAITKTRLGPEDVPLGQSVSFQMTATNNGPADATTVVVGDALPAGLAFTGATPSLGSYDSGTGLWTIPTLTNGQTGVLTLTATTTIPGLITNTAALRSLDQADTDPSNNLDTAMVNVVELADLAITKTVSPTTAQPGDTVTYTVTVTNNGPNTADDIQAVDPLRVISPTALSGSQVSQGTFDAAARVWDVGTLAPGDTATLTVEVLVGRTGSFLNTVTISQSSLPDPDLSNNTAQAVLVVPAADLAVTKTVDNAAPTVGQPIVYTINAQNLGPNTTTSAQVTDVLPAGLSYVSSTAGVGNYDPSTGIWSIGTLVAGDPAVTLTITATTTATGPIANTATIAAVLGPVDVNPANNSASITVHVAPQPADLVVAKSVSPVAILTGGRATFTITVHNLGPGVALGAVVTDTLPAGLTVVGALPAGCTRAGAKIECALGDIAVGATRIVTLVVTAAGPGRFTNTATATATPLDPTPPNNTAATALTVTPAPTTGAGGSGGAGAAGESATTTPPLAATGPDLELPVWVGLGLLVFGAVLLAAGRRVRRPS